MAQAANNSDKDMFVARCFPEHEIQSHIDKLDCVCRVCHGTLSSGNKYCYPVIGWESRLLSTFGISFINESREIHPANFCSKCHAAIGHSEKRGDGGTSIVFAEWLPHTDNCLLCLNHSKGGRPKKRKKAGRPKTISTVAGMKKWDGTSKLSSEVEDAVNHYINVKLKQSSLPCNSLEVRSGSQKILLTPVTVAKKESTTVSKRTLQRRSKETKDLMGIISDNSESALQIQTQHLVKSYDLKQREDIMSHLNDSHAISIPPKHLAAMKVRLNLPWNKIRDIRRWLSTFNVSLAPEGKARDITKEWVGKGILVEQVPASVLKGKKYVVEDRAWCYIFNLVGYILKYLDGLV